MWQGLAAQKELETALSQLQVSNEAQSEWLKAVAGQEARNSRIAQLEGKLQALESREPKKVGPRHCSVLSAPAEAFELRGERAVESDR